MIHRHDRSIRQPPKSARTALVEAYGRYLGAVDMRAGLKVEQRLRNVFERKRLTMMRDYPHIDLESSTFFGNLETHARRWWNSKALRGPSVDW